MWPAIAIAAACIGVLVGQLSSLPMYFALRRCEDRHAPRDFEAEQEAVDRWLAAFDKAWGWPDNDHALFQLEVWKRLTCDRPPEGALKGREVNHPYPHAGRAVAVPGGRRRRRR